MSDSRGIHASSIDVWVAAYAAAFVADKGRDAWAIADRCAEQFRRTWEEMNKEDASDE